LDHFFVGRDDGQLTWFLGEEVLQLLYLVLKVTSSYIEVVLSFELSIFNFFLKVGSSSEIF
jgi:hypothetical protein